MRFLGGNSICPKFLSMMRISFLPFGSIVKSELSLPVSDVRYLSEVTSQLLTNSSKDIDAALDQLTDLYILFARNYEGYAQVRYIDQFGNELVRINRSSTGVEAVPENLLQNKNSRPYFIKDVQLIGQVYVSQFDLNVENRVVEQPFQSMVRYVTPVVGANDEAIGVVVLNYWGNVLLEEIYSIASLSAGNFSLLNSQSYWLANPQGENEWAFMFGEDPGTTFANTYPYLWEIISIGEHDQESIEGNLHFLKTINLLDFVQPKQTRVSPRVGLAPKNCKKRTSSAGIRLFSPFVNDRMSFTWRQTTSLFASWGLSSGFEYFGRRTKLRN